jgi:hypothetical protein
VRKLALDLESTSGWTSEPIRRKPLLAACAALVLGACGDTNPPPAQSAAPAVSEGQATSTATKATTETEPPAPPEPQADTASSAPPNIRLPNGQTWVLGNDLLTGRIPATVDVPASIANPTDARPWFDIWSWQAFIAMSWPADPSHRGQPLNPGDPSTFLKATAGAQPVVWGAYKEANELFGQGSERPTPWDSYQVQDSPCPTDGHEKLMLMVTKEGTLLDATNETFSVPLVDQNLNYARYEIRFNEPQYDFVRGPDDDSSKWYYRAKNFMDATLKGTPLSMPVFTDQPAYTEGAAMLKAAWREMVAGDDLSRYYAVPAQIYEPDTKRCRQAKVGLVGLHVTAKLKQFPEWIWASFEQVDNVPPAHGTPPAKLSFNNGTDQPPTPKGYADQPQYKSPNLVPKDQRKAVQVTRYNPIPTTPEGGSTVDVNAAMQRLLAGTVWANYELVITQWPSDPTTFKTADSGGIYPADAGGAFPVDGAVNATMETYFQTPQDAVGAGGNSCMRCHYAADLADFSWVLQLRAH